MQKFIVLYCMPAAGLEEWAKTPEAERKTQENDLKMKWDAWMAEHKSMMAGVTAAVGKTKRITPEGVMDAKNDIMISSVVSGESQEEVAKVFEGHPHLMIPGAWIDVSVMNEMTGM
jgi:hypothetical protein